MNPISWLLNEDIARWNQWRVNYPHALCNLEGEYFPGCYLFEADFSGLNLRWADLRRACLIGADFRWADLQDADLRGAYLDEANFYGAKLTNAKFDRTSLLRTDLRRVHWHGQQMPGAQAEQLL